MTPTDPQPPAPPTPDLSRSPITAWAIIGVAATLGGWLLWEIERTIGLSRPHLWELLRTDRVFDLAMLDFTLTAGWAFLVLIERSGWKDWRLWAVTPLFFAAPSLGIAVFILLARAGRRE